MKQINRAFSALMLGAFAAAGFAIVSDSALARQAVRSTRAAATNFVNRVTIGEGGSHIQGNPAARVQVTEYVSYTCPHCAHFTETSDGLMRSQYIAPGLVKVEVRHIVRDPVDMAMTVAANCGAPSGFFRRHVALMAQQEAILNRWQALPSATTQQWLQLPMAQRLQRIAGDTGVTAWMRAQGLTAAQANACLSDTALQGRLVAMTNAGIAAGVEGTPSFAINGQLQPTSEIRGWPTLSTALDQRLAAR